MMRPPSLGCAPACLLLLLVAQILIAATAAAAVSPVLLATLTSLQTNGQWDLSGAEILSAALLPARSPHSRVESLEYRVQWSAPPFVSSATSFSSPPPPLLYSLFAESRSRRSVRRVCSVRAGSTVTSGAVSGFTGNATSSAVNSSAAAALSCIAQLPRGEDQWTLHLLAECDTNAMQQQPASLSRDSRCQSSVSLGFEVTTAAPAHSTVTLPPLAAELPSQVDHRPTFAAAPGVSLVANDPDVRFALCRFFNLTSGPSWTQRAGWCDPASPICPTLTAPGWFGLQCDATGQFVTSLQLPSNWLKTAEPMDLSAVFAATPQLQWLDWGNNPGLLLTRVDLSTLTSLISFSLTNLAMWSASAVSILFPSPCALVDLDLFGSGVDISTITRCSSLQEFTLSECTVPVPFALVASLPALLHFTAMGAQLSGEGAGAYAGLSGIVTPIVLANLNTTNPVLEVLDLSYSTLPFGLRNSSDNWPHLVSSSLQYLSLGFMPQLRTGSAGPVDALWLADLPALLMLDLVVLSNVVLRTSDFLFASVNLQTLSLKESPVIGSLAPLCRLHQLVDLELSYTGIQSTLPSNVSQCWPAIEALNIVGCALFGAIPDFRGLPALTTLSLSRNQLSGPLTADFALDSPGLSEVLLSSNALESPAPSFCGVFAQMSAVDLSANMLSAFPNLSCWRTSSLQLQENPGMAGSQVPPNFWELVGLIAEIDLSGCGFVGRFPDMPSRHLRVNSLIAFSIANNALTGRLPLGIDSLFTDYSNNQFTGALRLFDAPPPRNTTRILASLHMASAGSFSCEIDLMSLPALQSLTLSNSTFQDCDFANQTLVQLPTSIREIDISDCTGFKPMILPVAMNWQILRANRANVIGLSFSTSVSTLREIEIDGAFVPNFARPGSSQPSPLGWLLGSTTLQLLSCRGCGIVGSLQQAVFENFLPGSVLQTLRLSDCSLFGEITFGLIDAGQVQIPLSLQEFDLSGNVNFQGRLPSVPPIFTQLRSWQIGGTGIEGPVPESWSTMTALSQFNITATKIACPMVVSSDTQRLQCAEQPVFIVSQTTGVQSTSLSDPRAGVHCSALSIAATGSTSVSLDPSYHAHTLCTCDANSFGLNALCYRCPEGCTCFEDTIQNCFPVVERGAIGVGPAWTPDAARSVVDGSIAPFTVTALLPCPRTVTGSSLCNPDGIAWPSFYRISEQAGSAAVSAALTGSGASSSSDSDLDLSGWCYPGHTGRLCAACSNGYFSSGRWCLECLSAGVHVLILVANLLLIVALITYLYVKSPGAVNATRGLQLYLRRLASSAPVNESRSLRELRAEASGPASRSLSASTSFSDPSDEVTADPANPLKLLIFHCQQLSLLIHTSTSLPVVMSGLLSFLSAGSTGFSLSSLVALECLSSWTLRERCWMAVFAPALIGLFAALTALFSRVSRAGVNGHRAVQLQGRNESLLPADADGEQSSTFVVPRIYSVCVSLLYFLVFPCAQTVLSAVTCTDTRQSDQAFLNLFPDQACDDEWRRSVLPPAVIGLLFWVVAFPVVSTLMLFQLRSRLAASSGADSTSALAVWPICADLLLPYTAGRWYWEQLFLIRRLLLVAAVTIIPSSSLYLPLVLFSIIQLSALQQHWAHPYAHSLLNSGELASLYLLLINYISAIILQSGLVEGGFQQTANGWAAALFVVNLAFLLILVAGLFGFARQWIATRLAARRQLRL